MSYTIGDKCAPLSVDFLRHTMHQSYKRIKKQQRNTAKGKVEENKLKYS